MDSLKPNTSTVPRQATFETEPADTVRGRSIKRGGINLPYIDANAVKNVKPTASTATNKNSHAAKTDALKSLKEKEQKGKELEALKAKELKSLKEKKEKELKAKKEQLLKINNEKAAARDEADTKTQKDTKKDKEPKPLKETPTTSSKIDKENDLKALKEKYSKTQNGSKDQNYKSQSNNKVEKISKDTQARGRKTETTEKQPRAINGPILKSKKENDGPEEKIGFFQKLGRSLSPSKNKQTPPVDTTDPLPKSKSIYSYREKSPPKVLVVDEDRFAEVRIATPAAKPSNNKDESAHFKSVIPRKSDDNDSLNSKASSSDENTKPRKQKLITLNDNDFLSSKTASSDVDNKTRKQKLITSNAHAWTDDKSGSQSSIDSQKLKALRKINNSPRTSQPDEESVAIVATKNGKSLPSQNVKDSKEADSASLSSNASVQQEPYEQVVAERDILLTSEHVHKKRLRQLEEETNQLAEALDRRDREIKELRWNIDNPTSVRDVTDLTKKLQAEVEKLQNEIDQLMKEKKKYKILHNDSERKVIEVVQENDHLKDRIELYEQNKLPQLVELHQDNKKLDTSLKQLKLKLKETEEHFEILKSENIDLNEEVRSRRHEVQELLVNLKDQKTAELDLQKTVFRLEDKLKLVSRLEKELADAVAKTAIMEAEKEHVISLMQNKDEEMSSIKQIVESRDSEIENHKLAVELQKQEIDNLKEDIERQKKELNQISVLEKEVTSLKETLNSLMEELQVSQQENKTLKNELEDGNKTLTKTQQQVKENELVQETLNKMKRTLESEKLGKLTLEEDLNQSKDEVSNLQQQNMELNIQIGNMKEKLKLLENAKGSKKHKEKDSDQGEKLLDENKRLKMRLVEKNFTDVASEEEKKALSSRLEHLERKQDDNDATVRQLQGWVNGIYPDPPTDRLSPSVTGPVGRVPNNTSPRVEVTAQGHKTGQPKNKNKKTKKPPRNSTTMHEPIKKADPRVTVSLGDLNAENIPSRSSTPSLPMIQDIPEQASLYNSYFYIYKQKQKLLRQQHKIR